MEKKKKGKVQRRAVKRSGGKEKLHRVHTASSKAASEKVLN